MPTLDILIQGDQAEAAAEALKATLDDQGVTATVKPVTPERATDASRDGLATALAVTSLILSIPGAALAAYDLTQRLGKRKQAERLQAKARELRVERRVETTVVTLREGGSLEQLEVDKLLELAGQLARSANGGTDRQE